MVLIGVMAHRKGNFAITSMALAGRLNSYRSAGQKLSNAGQVARRARAERVSVAIGRVKRPLRSASAASCALEKITVGVAKTSIKSR